MFTKQRCLSKRKDTNFKANHNRRKAEKNPQTDVCLSAKIRILKQITTNMKPHLIAFKMFV